jgi:hypothetical protein
VDRDLVAGGVMLDYPEDLENEEDRAFRAKRTNMTFEQRLAKLENTMQEEIGQRIRADHELRHRVNYLEKICLMPALSRRFVGPIPWLWKMLGLSG